MYALFPVALEVNLQPNCESYISGTLLYDHPDSTPCFTRGCGRTLQFWCQNVGHILEIDKYYDICGLQSQNPSLESLGQHIYRKRPACSLKAFCTQVLLYLMLTLMGFGQTSFFPCSIFLFPHPPAHVM